jgi:hypothetical protein
MDIASKVVLGFVGSVVTVCAASCFRLHYRSKHAADILRDMEDEMARIKKQFQDGDSSRQQAEKQIDVAIDRFQAAYMNYCLSDKKEQQAFFEAHRVGMKKLLGYSE